MEHSILTLSVDELTTTGDADMILLIHLLIRQRQIFYASGLALDARIHLSAMFN